MSGGFFKGTSLEQDSRFGDKQKQLLQKMQFPPEYDLPCDLRRIRLDLLRPWIAARITAILGLEDDVVVDLVVHSLDLAQKAAVAGKKEQGKLDPRDLQITLTGFLEKHARAFVSELWALLREAAGQESGIPLSLLQAKKDEIMASKNAALEAARAQAAAITAAHAAQAQAQSMAAAGIKPEAGKRVSRFGPRPSDLVAPSYPAIAQPAAAFAPPAGGMPFSSYPRGGDDRRDRDRDRERDHRRRSRSPRRDRSPRRSHHSSSRREDRSRERSSRHKDRSRSRSRSRTRSRSRSRDRHSRRSSRRSHRDRRSSRSHSRSASPDSTERAAKKEKKRSKRSRTRSRSRSASRTKKASRSRSRSGSRSGSRSRSPSKHASRSRSRSRSASAPKSSEESKTQPKVDDDATPPPSTD